MQGEAKMCGSVMAMLAAVMLVVTAPAARASDPPAREAAGSVAPYGGAFGTYAGAGSLAVSGESAGSGMGCSSQNSQHTSNRLLGVNVAPLLRTGVLETHADASAGGGLRRASTSSVIHSVNLLSGLIRASTVKAVSTTTLGSTGFGVSTRGSAVVRLVIGRLTLNAVPPPNTSIALPGVGRVVLNEQIRKVTPSGASLTLNMIHVYLGSGIAGARAGTELIVGHALSGLGPQASASLFGESYATYAQVGKLISSGPSWPAGMCAGTAGRTVSNTMVGLTLPGILSTGTLVNTARGTVHGTTSSGEMTATVHDLSLLGGLVRARLVHAEARALATGGRVGFSDAGSSFVGLEVAGHRLRGTIRANTRVSLGNIRIWLHRVMRGRTGLAVRMIEVTVRGGNRLGLPAGTDIQVAAAGLLAAQ